MTDNEKALKKELEKTQKELLDAQQFVKTQAKAFEKQRQQFFINYTKVEDKVKKSVALFKLMKYMTIGHQASNKIDELLPELLS